MGCGEGRMELHGFGLGGCDREEAVKRAAMANAEFGVQGRNAVERLHFQFYASAFVLEGLWVVKLQSLAIITDNDDEMAENVCSQNPLDSATNAGRDVAEGIEPEGRYRNFKTGKIENDVGQRFGASGAVRKKAEGDGADIVERRGCARSIEKKPRWPGAVHADGDENEMIRNFYGDLRNIARKSELERCGWRGRLMSLRRGSRERRKAEIKNEGQQGEFTVAYESHARRRLRPFRVSKLP